VTPCATAWLIAGEHADEIARWQPSAAARPGPGPGSRARLAVSGDLVAADAMTAGPGSLEVADVICGRSEPGCAPPLTWLAGTMGSYPGCAVAAVWTGEGRCLVATRAGRPFTVSYFVPNGPGLRAARNVPVSGALACAMFVHGWLAARWPLTALDPARLVAVTEWRLPARTMTAGRSTPIPFVLYYEGRAPAPGSMPDPSSLSRHRMSSASGASMSA
jgi:hypothetical protein